MSDVHVPTAEPPSGQASNGKRSTLGKLFRFGVMSGLSFIVNVGGTWLLAEVVGLSWELAYAVGLVAVFCMNFMLMRLWVFAEGRGGSAKRQAGGFLLMTIGFRAMEYASFVVLSTKLGFDELRTIIGISVVATLLKFVVGRWIFRAPQAAE